MAEEQNKERELTDEDLEKAVGGLDELAGLPAPRTSVESRGTDEEVGAPEPRPGHDRHGSGSRQIKPF